MLRNRATLVLMTKSLIIALGLMGMVMFLAVQSFAYKPQGLLEKEGNAYPKWAGTQSGDRFFVVNDGLYAGANRTKIFGAGRPTTLWNDVQRTECYEHSIRLMVQMPVPSQLDNVEKIRNKLNEFGIREEEIGDGIKHLDSVEKVQKRLRNLGLGAEVVEKISVALNALQSNYVDGNTLSGQASNTISTALRKVNPKTFGGLNISCTNLRHLGNAMQYAATGYKIADFAIGAAVQEALAGDLALARLEIVEDVMKNMQSKAIRDNVPQRNVLRIDKAIFDAIRQARRNLERSEDYWGALMLELTDRRNELHKIGLGIGVKVLEKNAVKMMAGYYQKVGGLGAKAAQTKAASVAGLWAFSLLATYETIDAILDQHKKAQIAVTSATMGYILADEKKTFVEDFNSDGVKDTLKTGYDGGSGFGLTWVTLTDGKTKETYKYEAGGGFGNFLSIVPINDKLRRKENEGFKTAIEKALFGDDRFKAPDPSLEWLLEAYANNRQIKNNKLFSQIILFTPHLD